MHRISSSRIVTSIPIYTRQIAALLTRQARRTPVAITRSPSRRPSGPQLRWWFGMFVCSSLVTGFRLPVGWVGCVHNGWMANER